MCQVDWGVFGTLGGYLEFIKGLSGVHCETLVLSKLKGFHDSMSMEAIMSTLEAAQYTR